MERIRGRAVEHGRPHLARPRNAHQRLPGDARAERECRGAEPFDADQRAPRSHVKAEERADHGQVARADPGAPENARVRFGNPAPVVAADAEDGRPSRRAAGAVDAHDLLRVDTQVVAKRRVRGLGGAQLVFLHDGETGEVSKLSERVGRDARLVPLAAVERALLPRPADLRAELGEDQLVALLGIGALDLRQPELLLRRRPVRAIVSGRPRAQTRAHPRDDSPLQRIAPENRVQ